MKHFSKYLLILLLLIQSSIVGAQVDRATLIGAYIYNFANYVTWPKEADRDSFTMLLFSNNIKDINEIRVFSKTKLIKGKPISLKITTSVPRSLTDDISMIVVTSDQNSHFTDMYRIIRSRPVLLVSENYNDKRDVMINLYDTDKHGLVFEVNKANIINHDLVMDPEILLIGGTEIDVAQLYRDSQKSLDSIRQRMIFLSDSLSSLNQKIIETQKFISDQQESLLSQKALLEAQDVEVIEGKAEILKQKSEISYQEQLADEQKGLLAKHQASIQEQLIELNEQKTFIDRQQKEIEQSKVFLDSLKTEIKQKNIELGEQSDIISRQRIVVILSFLVGILLLIVLGSIVWGYRNKVKKNRQLQAQKNHIEEMNFKLQHTNKSLYETITLLRETQSQLVSSEKMASLGVLTAGIAHEINNPINFIYTGINSLKKDFTEYNSIYKNWIQEITDHSNGKDTSVDDSEIVEIEEIIFQTIEDIKIGAERAADIVKGLRNFSRIDKDTMQLSNIHEGIDSALLLLRNKFKNHITIEKHYQQLPDIECYPGKLNQAFLNIISNSIDAIENQGKIIISTRCEKDKIIIEIEDTGTGIPPEYIDKIFDPFFTTKSVGKGVGLGLSITFGIIKEHNGIIQVKSEPDRGTIFTILLPCVLKND